MVVFSTMCFMFRYNGGNESSKPVSTIIFEGYKTCNHCFPLRRAFLLLLCWVTTFYLYAPWRELSCHSEYNVHCPKVFIDWFILLVSFVLKLLVSSRPFKLEGVLRIYVLLSHEGQAENHLYVFPCDLNTHLTFIVSFSWSFVCVHFHVSYMVAKFLLSRICLSCLKFFWSQLTMLTYVIKIV
jgi:hypothetical protein